MSPIFQYTIVTIESVFATFLFELSRQKCRPTLPELEELEHCAGPCANLELAAQKVETPAESAMMVNGSASE